MARLAVEEDAAVVYHHVDNSRIFQGKPPQRIDFDIEYAEAIETIFTAYPKYLRVSKLPLEPADQLQLVQILYEAGILIAKS